MVIINSNEANNRLIANDLRTNDLKRPKVRSKGHNTFVVSTNLQRFWTFVLYFVGGWLGKNGHFTKSAFGACSSGPPKNMCSFHSLVLGPELLCSNNVYDALTTFNLSPNETETTKIWAKNTFRHPTLPPPTHIGAKLKNLCNDRPGHVVKLSTSGGLATLP